MTPDTDNNNVSSLATVRECAGRASSAEEEDNSDSLEENTITAATLLSIDNSDRGSRSRAQQTDGDENAVNMPDSSFPTVHHSRSEESPSASGVDDVFLQLKARDPEWLATTLQARVAQLNRTEAVGLGSPVGSGDKKRVRGVIDNIKKSPMVSDLLTSASALLHDLTQPVVSSDQLVSEYVASLRTYDWSATELGPMASWGVELRLCVNLCLADHRPSTLWWGKNHLCIYNEAYIPIAGKRHPWALGKPYKEVWPEVEDFIPLFEKGEKTGAASGGDHARFIVERNGCPEEIWASWSLIPIVGDDGVVCGHVNPVMETTKQALSERRISTLLHLGQSTSVASNFKDFWKQVTKGLLPNYFDVPFAVLYAAAPESSRDQDDGDSSGRRSPPISEQSSAMGATRHWTLAGKIGLPDDCPGLPINVDPDMAMEALTPLFRDAIVAGKVTLLRQSDNTFPVGLRDTHMHRIAEYRCVDAVLCPVGPTDRENTLGFLIIGVNPLRSFDTDYQQFIELIRRQLSTSLASVVLIEEELRRSRRTAEIAARDRMRLSEQLAETKHDAQEFESRFRRMADLAPVSMFHFDPAGNVIYANDAWFEITGHPRNQFYPYSWKDVCHEDDRQLIDNMWLDLSQGKAVLFEFRLKKPFIMDDPLDNGEQVTGTTWIMVSAYAELTSEGKVRGILGCGTDISRHKLLTGYQERRVQEAMELKRQQENFMDMTSHEARNPLSAIMLCTESTITSYGELLASKKDPISIPRETLETHLESAEIVMACAQHQKRIIDDVLTLSKLDSGLLLITPVEVNLYETISQALKMFEGELQKADVSLRFVVEKACKDMNLQWVRMDPSRVLQILINLLTNAIKFTQSEATRQIVVTLGASTERPDRFGKGAQFFSIASSKEVVMPVLPEDGELVYLSLTVEDTGRGITSEEMTRLFQRFQQASPKTHVQYGGSGLGLFICRELARLQGGQIGVASESGKGSTFAFYIAASPCEQPKTGTFILKGPNTHNARRRSHGSIAPSSEPSLPSPSLLENVKEVGLEGADESTPAPVHLLIVEDNLVNQKVMSKQLRLAGYIVTVANHGVEALEHIRASNFCMQSDGSSGLGLDVVLMDVEMPIMDGLTCAREIRAMEAAGEIIGHVPIVAVTANARAEQQVKALDAGMDTVVTKPFRMQELLPELQKVMDIE